MCCLLEDQHKITYVACQFRDLESRARHLCNSQNILHVVDNSSAAAERKRLWCFYSAVCGLYSGESSSKFHKRFKWNAGEKITNTDVIACQYGPYHVLLVEASSKTYNITNYKENTPMDIMTFLQARYTPSTSK